MLKTKTAKTDISVSFGNKKLPADTMIFNLPARMTCPGRTAFCAGKCYALKAERIYPQVLPSRSKNFDLSRSESFADEMIGLIQSKINKIGRVRIHESGDFYNQAYLDKWYQIARAFPWVTFYAYTKSFHLDFSSKPANFVLIGSLDQSTDPAQLANYHARKEYFDNTFTIVEKNAPASCIQDCSVCDKCWTGKNLNLTVNVH